MSDVSRWQLSHPKLIHTVAHLQIFAGGAYISWGRIVALYCFGGLLALRCCRQENLQDLTSNVADWLAVYTETRLDAWIRSHGGWVMTFYNDHHFIEVNS